MHQLIMSIHSNTADRPQRSSLAVMNFLNEVAGTHPQAISFASGRPTEAYFDLPQWVQEIQRFAAHFAQTQGYSEKKAFDLLGQYGRTNGIIGDLITEQVRKDEGIDCEPSQVLVTSGCQEAMELCATTLCKTPSDVILVRNPTYIGITGIADIHSLAIESFEPADDSPGAFCAAVEAAIARIAAQGRRVRLLYLIPDFDNPTGLLLSRNTREAVLETCAAHGVLILEDNPYGMFTYEGERIPTLFSLDRQGSVIYLGTYSKTLCPGLRIGFAILPPMLYGEAGAARQLMGRLSEAKSFGTCNTSQVTQAIVGGVLLREGGSLRHMVSRQLELYRANRDLMLAQLEKAFAGCGDRIHWNRPSGGFFVVVNLPFDFGAVELDSCAREHGVICMPLSFFALDGSYQRSVRLAYSNVGPGAIVEGIRRFAAFVRTRLE